MIYRNHIHYNIYEAEKKEKKIAGEYAGMFGVGLNVLRQDIVTFLYRYANLK